MENKEDNSGHVSKLVHQFYFVKLWPTEPDSISKIRKEENIVMKINQDISEITDKIAKKTCHQRVRRNSVAIKGKILRDFNMALDELNIWNIEVASGGWFGEKLDKNSLNYLKIHGSKSLGEEKQILRDIKIQQKDVASFKSLEVLKETLLRNGGSIFFTRKVKNLEEMIRGNYLNDRQKLVIEIEQFQIQHMERACKYDSLKKSIKHQIKLLCDDNSLKNKREWMEFGTRSISPGVEAINGKLYSLREKLNQKYNKKYEAKQRILKLKELYHENNLNYYKYCSLINKVHQLSEEKDVTLLDEMSSSEVENFTLEWNSSKAFREDYEKKILQSLERRQLSGDGRRRPDKSCSTMHL
ncbi:putative proton pump-interactor [Medicago truncatula]|uniref:Proton pump interactor, putative n=1 Tax=Medicago truncatula TaxID=3880 RepID=A0A072TF78_MEDTR|nr:proton pump-interactor BIP131 isoform X1 [Medicago truncatula]XP_039686709.1 proton pump-interactor BIP131 isoform X1 [Medicago truncatula]XP_039686710.1 proton pump-interactor BIP131 isoform X1 [Medicago truncatula]KEH16032.1 proton pump interactor, putative [Medicago truncatula]RHN75753.1 putative proton pump-interactor [Medicago truncatula]